MKISKGQSENGVVVGNTYDKYGSSNTIVRRLMQGFELAVIALVDRVRPATIHEVGCGEGYWTLKWIEQGIDSRGSDFSHSVVDMAKENALERKLSADIFKVSSIYDLKPETDAAQLLVCLEVLEHLEYPERGLLALRAIAQPYLIISVPREPLWSVMNMTRGKYLNDWGNTPGHIQRWSKRQFMTVVSRHFEVLMVRSPIPWTILLCRRVEEA